jgi:hypothetical protein
MSEFTKKMMLMQGYGSEVVCGSQDINFLVRWGPFACASLGALGLYLRSPGYFIVLGLLTTIGVFTSRSFYDYIYNYTLRFVFRTEKTPRHGGQRRLACSIGTLIYISAGIGFYVGNVWLAYAPTAFLIALGYIAALTHWCFASVIYNLFSGKKNACGG